MMNEKIAKLKVARYPFLLINKSIIFRQLKIYVANYSNTRTFLGVSMLFKKLRNFKIEKNRLFEIFSISFFKE